MAHLMGAQFSNTGLGPNERDWLRHTNSASLTMSAIGSGVAVATLSAANGCVKALDFSIYNTPAFILRDGAGATLAAFASGAVGAQRFQPVWLPYKGILTIAKASGTAESTWGVLYATSQVDLGNVAL